MPNIPEIPKIPKLSESEIPNGDEVNSIANEKNSEELTENVDENPTENNEKQQEDDPNNNAEESDVGLREAIIEGAKREKKGADVFLNDYTDKLEAGTDLKTALNDINEEIKATESQFSKDLNAELPELGIDKSNNNAKESKESATKPELDEKPKALAIIGTTVEIPGENGSFKETINLNDLDSKTQEFFRGADIDPEAAEVINEPLNTEETAEAEKILNYVLNPENGKWEWDGTFVDPVTKEPLPPINPENRRVNQENFKNIELGENEDAKELEKLLLRIAIRLGTKMVAIIARNIGKNSNDPDVKTACGIFADLTEEGGKVADTMIAGKKGSVGEAMYRYANRKNKKSEENEG